MTTPAEYIRDTLDVPPAVKERLLEHLRFAHMMPHSYVVREGGDVCSACGMSRQEAYLKVPGGGWVPCLGREVRDLPSR